MSSSNTPSAYSICCALFSRGDGKFHWAIVIPSDDSKKAHMFHALNSTGAWLFERKTRNLANSLTLCVAVKIGAFIWLSTSRDRWHDIQGSVRGASSVDYIGNLLKNIPMSIPAADQTIEPEFTCRVWFKQAIRVLAANRVLSCPNVYVLEREIIQYGNAQNAKTVLGGGYKYHVASEVH